MIKVLYIIILSIIVDNENTFCFCTLSNKHVLDRAINQSDLTKNSQNQTEDEDFTVKTDIINQKETFLENKNIYCNDIVKAEKEDEINVCKENKSNLIISNNRKNKINYAEIVIMEDNIWETVDFFDNTINWKFANCCEDESSSFEHKEDAECSFLVSMFNQDESKNSLEGRQQSATKTEKNCSTDNLEEEWNFETFINGTLECIHQYTNGYFLKDETIKILEYIWKYISTDKNELAIFLSNSLHNTSFFKSFKNIHDDSLYACKGLLQIQGKENYEILSKISGTDYVTRPELLGIVSKSSIKDTGLFWKHLMSNKEMTWENSMDALKIENWVMYRKLQSKGEYPFDVLLRHEIFNFLYNLFLIK